MQPHILITDDSSTNRLLFSMMMTRVGCTSDTAASGAEALILFSQSRYDIVFLDLNMPKMDGIETARALQSKNKYKIPLYAISGDTDPPQKIFFPEAGIRKCITKPLDRKKMFEVLKECALTVETRDTTPCTQSIPRSLLSVYARELRARSAAAQNLAAIADIPCLMREAHTIRALAQMLKNQDIESAAAAIERCDRKDAARLTQQLKESCIKAAHMIETVDISR